MPYPLWLIPAGLLAIPVTIGMTLIPPGLFVLFVYLFL